MLIAIVIVGVLSSVAYPSFVAQLHKVRRADALIALMQVQSAQDRWRSNHASYGDATQIGVATRSPAGHYTLELSNVAAGGYEVVASATGGQARDLNCAVMKVSVQGANIAYRSGPDASTANGASANRLCWGETS